MNSRLHFIPSLLISTLSLIAFFELRAADPPAPSDKLPTAQEMISSLSDKPQSDKPHKNRVRGITVAPPLEVTVHLHFQTDSIDLTEKTEQEWVENVAASVFNSEAMKSHTFVIEGHTDKRGSETYNLNLSERRAKAIRDLLISKGVSPERLRSQGKGKTELLDDGDTEEAHWKNRRVVFIRE